MKSLPKPPLTPDQFQHKLRVRAKKAAQETNASMQELLEIQIYPITDHVADKICAVYALYGREGSSSRVKDLVDLVIIALKRDFDATEMHKAVHKEADRRRRAGTVVNFPSTFELPDDSWVSGYTSQAADVHDLPKEFRSFSGAQRLLDTFITPLLQKSSSQSSWSHRDQVWLD